MWLKSCVRPENRNDLRRISGPEYGLYVLTSGTPSINSEHKAESSEHKAGNSEHIKEMSASNKMCLSRERVVSSLDMANKCSLMA